MDVSVLFIHVVKTTLNIFQYNLKKHYCLSHFGGFVKFPFTNGSKCKHAHTPFSNSQKLLAVTEEKTESILPQQLTKIQHSTGQLKSLISATKLMCWHLVNNYTQRGRAAGSHPGLQVCTVRIWPRELPFCVKNPIK